MPGYVDINPLSATLSTLNEYTCVAFINNLRHSKIVIYSNCSHAPIGLQVDSFGKCEPVSQEARE
jgi:aspartate/tyrosine/aromatic aminotransferase